MFGKINNRSDSDKKKTSLKAQQTTFSVQREWGNSEKYGYALLKKTTFCANVLQQNCMTNRTQNISKLQ